MKLQTAYYLCPACGEIIARCFYKPLQMAEIRCEKAGRDFLMARVRKPT